jgi:hypothetical protein
MELGSASLELVTATNKEDARKAADSMEKYNPPPDVKAAIEHFVITGGPQTDDPDLESNSSRIKDWIEQVCVT